jgi:hypothetical protein
MREILCIGLRVLMPVPAGSSEGYAPFQLDGRAEALEDRPHAHRELLKLQLFSDLDAFLIAKGDALRLLAVLS